MKIGIQCLQLTVTDWYFIFVAKVKQKYESCFRWYKSRVKDFKINLGLLKDWKSMKSNHRLYRDLSGKMILWLIPDMRNIKMN